MSRVDDPDAMSEANWRNWTFEQTNIRLIRKANDLYALLRMAQIKVESKRPQSADKRLKDIDKFNKEFERAEVFIC